MRMDRSVIYRGLYQDLKNAFGREEADILWALSDAALEYLYKKYQKQDTYSTAGMIFPPAAVYMALKKRHPDYPAMELLENYGTKTGWKMYRLIHGFSSVPGMSEFIWKHVNQIMYRTSSEKLGYIRKIRSEAGETAAVDILRCPYYEMAKTIRMPQICHVICYMDKVYMNGFKQIRYTRTKSVAEGGDCCDYQLSWDENKK